MSDFKTSRRNCPGSTEKVHQPQNRARWTVWGGLLALGFGLNVFRVNQSAFTRDYAVCSASHDIYTVDEAEPRVECVVIGGTRILDTGSLGASEGNCAKRRSYSRICCIVDVRNRWKDRRKSSLVLSTVDKVLDRLRVINVQPGSIMVPGLTGKHDKFSSQSSKK